MNVFMGKVKRMSEFIAMILFFVAAFFSLLFYIGKFDGAFMPVIGNLFSMLLQVGIWLIIPLCIVMKRRSYARWAALAVSLYWLITTLFSLLDSTAMAVGTNPPLTISVGVFSFLVACALIVMISFALASVVRKDAKVKLIAFFIYVGALLLFLVLFALSAAVTAKLGFGWNVYFSHICNYILIPFAMGFIAITFGFREEEFMIPWIKERKVVPQEEKAVVSVDEEEEDAKTADFEEETQSVGSDFDSVEAEDSAAEAEEKVAMKEEVETESEPEQASDETAQVTEDEEVEEEVEEEKPDDQDGDS